MLIWGMPFYLYGKRVAGLLTFPCAYLAFCIPLNFLDGLTFPLRLWSAAIAASLLNGLAIPVQRSGTAIVSTAGQGFQLDVADPCSGLRSLLAMMALIAAYGYLTESKTGRRWLLFACSIPIAMLANIVRVASIGVAAGAIGQDAAMRVYHDYSGYIVFTTAVLGMLGVQQLIRRLGPGGGKCRPEA
jgi:exosortase